MTVATVPAPDHTSAFNPGHAVQRSLLLIFLMLVSSCSRTASVPERQPVGQEAAGVSTDRRIKNTIEIQMSSDEFAALKEITGKRTKLSRSKIIVNGQQAPVRSMNIRGGASLYYRRKSLAITLEAPVAVQGQAGMQQMAEFDLVSLNQDYGYYHNRFAFEALQMLGVLAPTSSYGMVTINGSNEGVYLIFKDMKAFAWESLDAAFMARTDGYSSFDVGSFDYRGSKTSYRRREFASRLAEIDAAVRSPRAAGPRLANQLESLFDLRAYMRWLAFNYIVQNGDYADELFFVSDGSARQPIFFRIIPWDYDDVLSPKPHEGWAARNKVLGHQLIFSSENKLDVLIGTDPFLYAKYKAEMKEVIGQLTRAFIHGQFENIYTELVPYLSVPEIVAISASDRGGAIDKTKLKALMASEEEHLIKRLSAIDAYLRDQAEALSSGVAMSR